MNYSSPCARRSPGFPVQRAIQLLRNETARGLHGLTGLTQLGTLPVPIRNHLYSSSCIRVHLWLRALCVLCDSAVNPISRYAGAPRQGAESLRSAQNFHKKYPAW